MHDDLTDTLTCRAHKHGEARGCAPGPLHVGVAVDVGRDAAVVVCQLGEPVVDAHQGVGIVVWLVEPHGRRRGAQRVVEDLPDFPRLKLRDVLVGRQALKVNLDLRPRSDRHVVDQSPCSCVADVLQVLNDLRDAFTPKGSRLFNERRLGVGLLP